MLEDGKRQLVFIAGLAGEGKTTLAEHFADSVLSQRSNSHVVVAIGRCNEQTGTDEAYLPFRDILSQLTGVKPTLLNLTLDPEKTIWSKSIIAGVAQALKEYGPDLIGTFVPGAALPARVLASAFSKGGQSFTQGQAARPGLDFIQIAKQFTGTLQGVAKDHPLIIILDDLQWADNDSIKLFNRLRTTLKDSRIFFLVTYRTDEVNAGRDGTVHLLKTIVPVAKEESDALVITLDSTQDEQTPEFVKDLLTAMNVEADDEFSKTLLSRTNGQPLLTVETIRYLQGARYLISDEAERWHVAPKFSWDKIPAQLDKLENLIAVRLNRLTPELREILNFASIEGQDFTAQVIMDILGKEEREILHALSGKLGKEHQLVTELGESRVGTHVLSRFRFVNSTFHKTVYESIHSGERRLAHGRVARSIEKFYGSNSANLAVQLEHHYKLAIEPFARAKYLNKIAFQLFTRNEKDAAEEKYLEAASIAASYGDFKTAIDARMHYAVEFTRDKNEKKEEARAELESLLKEAESLDHKHAQAFILRQLGIGESNEGRTSSGVQYYIKSLQLAEELDDTQLQGQVLTSLANRAKSEKDFDKAEELFNRRLKIAVISSDERAELITRLNLSDLNIRQGNISQAERYVDKMIELAAELDAKDQLVGIQILQAEIASYKGQYALSGQLLRDAILKADKLGFPGRIRTGLLRYAESLCRQNRNLDALLVLLHLFENKQLSADQREQIAELILSIALPQLYKQHEIDISTPLKKMIEVSTHQMIDPLLGLITSICNSPNSTPIHEETKEFNAVLDVVRKEDAALAHALHRIVNGERDTSDLIQDVKPHNIAIVETVLASFFA